MGRDRSRVNHFLLQLCSLKASIQQIYEVFLRDPLLSSAKKSLREEKILSLSFDRGHRIFYSANLFW